MKNTVRFFIGNKVSITLAIGQEGQTVTYVGVVSYRDSSSRLYRIVCGRGEYLQIDLERRQASFANSSRSFQVLDYQEVTSEDGEVEKNFENLLTQATSNANLRMSEGKSETKHSTLTQDLNSLKETTTMILNLSTLPVAVRGKVATEKKVAIRENGQIQFNSLVTKEVNGATHVQFDWDSKARTLTLIMHDAEVDNSLKLNRGKDGDGIPTLSASGILKLIQFDYAAGAKVFSEGEKNLKIGKTKSGNLAIALLKLEDGEREKVEKVSRPRKQKTATATATATPAADVESTDEVDESAIL